MTATLYSYSDASAPVLSNSGSGGDLYTILKAVLIDGYGTRTPVGGWTMPFEDAPNNTFVLKNPIHTAYLRIDDGQDYRWAHAKMFRTMTDVNSGTDEVPNANNMGGLSNHFFPKRYNNATPGEQWHVLVEDAGEWFIWWTPGASYPAGFFFGHIDPLNAAFPQSKVLMTGWTDNTSLASNDFRYGLFDNETQGNWYMQDDRFQFQERGGEEARSWIDTTVMQNPNPVDGKVYFQQVYVRSQASPIIPYGRIPNMFRSLSGDTGVFSHNQKFTIGADKYIALDWNTATYAFKYDADT